MIETAARENRGAKGDRFSLSYTAVSIAVMIFVLSGEDLDRMFNLYFLLIPILGLPLLTYVIFMLISLVRSALRLHWRRALSVLVAPAIAVALTMTAERSGITPAYIRFEINRSLYQRQVADMTVDRGFPKIKVWNWGEEGGAGVQNIFYYLVYDSSDQIKLPLDKRSPIWLQEADWVAGRTGFYAVIHPEKFTHNVRDYLSRISVQHLAGHFYAVTQYE